MSAREDILNRLHKAGKGSWDPLAQSPQERLAAPDDRLGRSIGAEIGDPRSHFIARAEAAKTSVEAAADAQQVPALIARQLAANGCAAEIALDPGLQDLPWQAAGLDVLDHAAEWARDPLSSVTRAVCGIAETGTLVCVSGQSHDPRLSYLAHRNFVIVDSDQVVATYEDAWSMLRTWPAWPRGVHFITGPSKTADIEQTIEYGAHGPAHLHVILLGS